MKTLRYICSLLFAYYLVAKFKIIDFIKWVLGIEKKVKVSRWEIIDAFIVEDPAGPASTPVDVDTDWIDFSSPYWSRDIDGLVPQWDAWRLTIVCAKNDKVRRLVCRRGETMHYPGDVMNMRSTRLIPRLTVNHAVIVTNDGEEIDVTSFMNEFVVCTNRRFHPYDLIASDFDDFTGGRIHLRIATPNGDERCGVFEFDNPNEDMVTLYS
jgi:hypothetical protein